MRSMVALAALSLGLLGCGNEIGDACVIASDCSPNGDRQCDTASEGGYCTIRGCDYDTCPEEAVCVRFFSGGFSDAEHVCNPDTEDKTTDVCSLDELCSIAGNCVPRSSEIRFCMRKCDSDDDCRDHYECRKVGGNPDEDPEILEDRAHGGEPVLEPGRPLDDGAPKFCALAP